jgi:ribosome-binding factor A
MRRVNEALKEIIGTALTQDVKDPRIGFVTLTGVDTAPDLSHAKVYVSVYGKQAEKDATMEGLRAARAYLQRLVNDELDLKRTPVLEFVYDESVDRGMRIQAMLKSSGVADLPPEEMDEIAASLGPADTDLVPERDNAEEKDHSASDSGKTPEEEGNDAQHGPEAGA